MWTPHDAQSEKNKMEDIYATVADDYEFEWLPEIDLDFENPLAVNKELTGKSKTSEATPSTSETAAMLNDAEIGEFIEKNKNINTAKKTKSDLNV